MPRLAVEGSFSTRDFSLTAQGRKDFATHHEQLLVHMDGICKYLSIKTGAMLYKSSAYGIILDPEVSSHLYSAET